MNILETLRNFGRGQSLVKEDKTVLFNDAMTEVEFLEKEIKAFLTSDKRRQMIEGEAYYQGVHDVAEKVRTAIGENGQPEAIHNLPNNRVTYNTYANLVDQKANYLLANPIEPQTEEAEFKEKVAAILDTAFDKRIRAIGVDALNCGIGYLLVYVADGELKYKRLKPYEVLPFWKDEEHEALDAFIRIYGVEEYKGREKKTVQHVEYYTLDGVKYFIYTDAGKLEPDISREDETYLTYKSAEGVKGFNWARLPLIAFKYNANEQPLLARVKSLQDALNDMMSGVLDCIQEDSRNTILVVKNYEGTKADEFRHNLSQYGVVFVRTEDGAEGGVDTLQIEVNPGNYEIVIKLLKKAIIECGRGYDAKDDRLGGNANQLNIKSMYSDIDLDAGGMQLEFSVALDRLLYFVGLVADGFRVIKHKPVLWKFNRDIIINEADTIANARDSVGILSMRTIVANHPWTADANDELRQIEKERSETIPALEDYAKPTETGENTEE